MLVAYRAAGNDPARFWSLTPRLFALEMRGSRQEMERQAKERIQAAWLTAVMSRAEKMPKLSEVLGEDEAKVPMTHDEIAARLRAMTQGMEKKRWSEWVSQA